MTRPWQPWHDRYAKRGGGPAPAQRGRTDAAPADTITEEQLKEFQEIISDAEICPRLTTWEQGFLSQLSDRLQQYGLQTRLSEKQIAILRKIAADKIYASG